LLLTTGPVASILVVARLRSKMSRAGLSIIIMLPKRVTLSLWALAWKNLMYLWGFTIQPYSNALKTNCFMARVRFLPASQDAGNRIALQQFIT
jgi:hypothetical protein